MQDALKCPDGRLLLFARTPVPGQVKRRLAADVGARAACDIHCAMTEHLAGVMCGAALMPATLCAWPDADSPWLRELAARHGLQLETQQGDNLGERMFHALAAGLRHADFALLIGSDCPGIDAAYLEAAAARLQAGVPWVFGPAVDGGYGLVGTRRVDPAPFHAIDWGTARVMEQTRARCRAAGLAWQELASLQDIDTRADWLRLQRDQPHIYDQLRNRLEEHERTTIR